jgi:outer membrane protein TolC
MTPVTTLLAACLLAAAPEPLPVLTLDQAVEAARRDALELQVAGERLAQARTLARRAWSHYLPQITAGAAWSANSEDVVLDLPTSFAIRDLGTPTSRPRATLPAYDPARPFSPVNLPGEATTLALIPTSLEELELQRKAQYGGQIEVKQALVAPQLWPAIRNAYLAGEVAGHAVEATRREVLFGVTQLYYGAATLKESAEVQARTLAAWQRRERDAEALVAQGAAPRLALLKARTDRARAEQDLLRARNAYASARLALATLLVRDPDFDVARPPEPPPPPDDGDLEGGVLTLRPDVRAALGQADLARGQRQQARFRYLPTLGLAGSWRWASVTGFTGTHDSWSVSLGLQWTLFDGGLREAELSDAGHKVAEAEAAAALLGNRARDEVRRARLDLDSARAARQKAAETVALAKEALEQAQRSFEAGVATSLEVADAISASQNAELAEVAETLGAQLAVLRLEKAAGTFAP